MRRYFAETLWPDRLRWALHLRPHVLTLSMSASSRVESTFGAMKERVKNKTGLLEMVGHLDDLQIRWDARKAEASIRCGASNGLAVAVFSRIL
jgi:hypothetical protein